MPVRPSLCHCHPAFQVLFVRTRNSGEKLGSCIESLNFSPVRAYTRPRSVQNPPASRSLNRPSSRRHPGHGGFQLERHLLSGFSVSLCRSDFRPSRWVRPLSWHLLAEWPRCSHQWHGCAQQFPTALSTVFPLCCSWARLERECLTTIHVRCKATTASQKTSHSERVKNGWQHWRADDLHDNPLNCGTGHFRIFTSSNACLKFPALEKQISTQALQPSLVRRRPTTSSFFHCPCPASVGSTKDHPRRRISHRRCSSWAHLAA